MNSTEYPVVIGVGASAGGVEALIELASNLPPDFGAPMLVVLHVAPSGASVLSGILDRRSTLPATTAEDGEQLRAGHIYVAPPDRHLRLHDGHIHLDREPRVNGHRPAADPMLRSLAAAYARDSVGVVLSGTRDDGTLGLAAIKAAGGRAFVQDPDEALYPSMPASALHAVDVDGCLPLSALADRLTEIAAAPPPNPARMGAGPQPLGRREPTRFTCPDCGGAIFREDLVSAERLACSVGHEYSPESFADEQARQLESALWAAVRTLEDRASLLDSMAARSDRRGNDHTAARQRLERDEAIRRASTIRSVIAQADLVGEP